MKMNQYPGINIKIELVKDVHSKDLGFIIHFNAQAPNFNTGQQNIRWMPTKEEQLFLTDTLKLLKQDSNQDFQPQQEMNYHDEQVSPSPPPMEQPFNQSMETQTNQNRFQSNTPEKIEHIINKNKSSY